MKKQSLLQKDHSQGSELGGGGVLGEQLTVQLIEIIPCVQERLRGKFEKLCLGHILRPLNTRAIDFSQQWRVPEAS